MKTDIDKNKRDQGEALTEMRKGSCSSGACLLSNPRTLAFIIPFLGVTALEQVLAGINSCFSATVCNMCIVSKTAIAIAAGLAGMTIQKAISRRNTSNG